MRLSDHQIQSIQKISAQVFGKEVKAYLFGSRTDDALRGGDIDLLISAEDHLMNIKNKLMFLVKLKKEIGDQKIDIVFDKKQGHKNTFLDIIKSDCILLS